MYPLQFIARVLFTILLCVPTLLCIVPALLCGHNHTLSHCFDYVIEHIWGIKTARKD
jgi:hypothetical protein